LSPSFGSAPRRLECRAPASACRHDRREAGDAGGANRLLGLDHPGRSGALRCRRDAAGLQRVGERGDERLTRFEFGLARREFVDTGLDAVLVEQGAAGEPVDIGPQRGDPVLIGVLAGGFARDQPRRQVVLAEDVPAGGAAAGRGQVSQARPANTVARRTV
jgi:hypothetical protein